MKNKKQNIEDTLTLYMYIIIYGSLYRHCETNKNAIY